MLKEVGASGQISLGKTYAGRLFDVIVHADDRVELIPVDTVAATPPSAAEIISAPDGCTQWALDNREALEQYALQVEEAGTAAEQLQRYLMEHPE